MNQEQLMKFTLRQMEMERNAMIKKKKSVSSSIIHFCKKLAGGRFFVKRNIGGND